MVANLFYDLLFFDGPESIINQPYVHLSSCMSTHGLTCASRRSLVPWLNHNLHAPHGTTHIHVPASDAGADAKVAAVSVDPSALV
jgi:hypothetical protein